MSFHNLVPAIAIDMKWGAFLRALGYALCLNRNEPAAAIWPSASAVMFLSVRSGFDRLLAVKAWPAGSEVVLSALTIRDMESIVGLHDLRPIGVDLSTPVLLPSCEDLDAVVSARTKAVVITQLFGQIADLEEIADFTRRHGLLLIEDCAQAFDGVYQGSPYADVSMFSFGPIKRHTALFGSQFVVSDETLRRQLEVANAALPETSASWFFWRVIRYGVLKAVCSKPIYGILDRMFVALGSDIDLCLYRMARGFGKTDLASKIRRRPCRSARQFLHDRLRFIPPLPGSWVVALQTDQPAHYARTARKAGVAASAIPASLTVIGEETALPKASRFLSRLVFLASHQSTKT